MLICCRRPWSKVKGQAEARVAFPLLCLWLLPHLSPLPSPSQIQVPRWKSQVLITSASALPHYPQSGSAPASPRPLAKPLLSSGEARWGDMRSEVGTLGQRQTAELGKGLGRTVPLSPACTRSGGRMNKPQDYRPTNLLSYVATSSVFPLQANILGVSKNLGALPSAGFMRAASPTPPAQHGRSQ